MALKYLEQLWYDRTWTLSYKYQLLMYQLLTVKFVASYRLSYPISCRTTDIL